MFMLILQENIHTYLSIAAEKKSISPKHIYIYKIMTYSQKENYFENYKVVAFLKLVQYQLWDPLGYVPSWHQLKMMVDERESSFSQRIKSIMFKQKKP